MSLDLQALEALFELSRDAVIAVREDRVVFANPAAAALLPVEAGDRAGDHIPEAVLTDPSERFVAAASWEGRPMEYIVVRDGDISLYTVTRSGAPAAEDPSRDRALNELGGDLLTMRVALDGLMKKTDGSRDESTRPYTASLYQSYYRMKRLLSHITLADGLRRKHAPSSPRLVDLGRLCGELCATVSALIKDAGPQLSFTAEEELTVCADPALLERMLLNLLANSLQHTDREESIRVVLSRRGRQAVIAVDDPGGGISAERLAKLLSGGDEPPLTDTAAGPGLGLVIVRGIAELYGGTLLVESRRGKGTLLRVSLPLPEPDKLRDLRQPDNVYRTDGMDAVLTELSVVLDKSYYEQRFFD